MPSAQAHTRQERCAHVLRDAQVCDQLLDVRAQRVQRSQVAAGSALLHAAQHHPELLLQGAQCAGLPCRCERCLHAPERQHHAVGRSERRRRSRLWRGAIGAGPIASWPFPRHNRSITSEAEQLAAGRSLGARRGSSGVPQRQQLQAAHTLCRGCLGSSTTSRRCRHAGAAIAGLLSLLRGSNVQLHAAGRRLHANVLPHKRQHSRRHLRLVLARGKRHALLPCPHPCKPENPQRISPSGARAGSGSPRGAHETSAGQAHPGGSGEANPGAEECRAGWRPAQPLPHPQWQRPPVAQHPASSSRGAQWARRAGDHRGLAGLRAAEGGAHLASSGIQAPRFQAIHREQHASGIASHNHIPGRAACNARGRLRVGGKGDTCWPSFVARLELAQPRVASGSRRGHAYLEQQAGELGELEDNRRAHLCLCEDCNKGRRTGMRWWPAQTQGPRRQNAGGAPGTHTRCMLWVQAKSCTQLH